MKKNINLDRSAPNTGRGWIIVIALFLMLSIVITARNSLGLMMPFWKEDMDWSYKFVATASALMMVTMAISAPVLGSIIDRFGSRTIYAIGMTVIGILCSFMIEPWQLITLFSLIGGVAFAAMAPRWCLLLLRTISKNVWDCNQHSGSTAGQFAIMPVFALLITCYLGATAFS